MNPGSYIAVQVGDRVKIAWVMGAVRGVHALKVLDTDYQFYHADGSFYEGSAPGGTKLEEFTQWVAVPVFLQDHVRSNAMLEWAQSKFNEQAYKQAEGRT